jgi:hypothetical protein
VDGYRHYNFYFTFVEFFFFQKNCAIKMKMEDELLYRGRFDHIGDRKLNSIRLFVSSTFTGKFLGDKNKIS